MGEALRNMVVLVWALSAVSTNADAKPNVTVISEEQVEAQQPTIIYGAAKEADGESDEVVVEQPAGSGNPLGNPIINPDEDNPVSEQKNVNPINQVPEQPVQKSGKVINEVTSQNPPISPDDTPQKMDDEIQNTLYESGNRIYDVQSYPVKDVNTVTEPNVDNEVVNYPIY